MRPPSWAWMILCAAGALPLCAQADSDDTVIDALLAQKTITWDNAAWLVGHASGALADGTAPNEAVAKAAQAGWGSRAAQTPVDLGSYSQLLVKALGVPGGILYSWFPGPRYAYRELVFRRLIPGSKSPDAPVSGQDAMLYLQNVQTWKETHR